MAADLGSSQISALLESVPGIANVLRSPVADAMVNLIRAGAGVGPFDPGDADELVQYAVRRGLISGDEGERVIADVRSRGKKPRAVPSTPRPVAPPKRDRKPVPRKPVKKKKVASSRAKRR